MSFTGGFSSGGVGPAGAAGAQGPEGPAGPGVDPINRDYLSADAPAILAADGWVVVCQTTVSLSGPKRAVIQGCLIVAAQTDPGMVRVRIDGRGYVGPTTAGPEILVPDGAAAIPLHFDEFPDPEGQPNEIYTITLEASASTSLTPGAGSNVWVNCYPAP